MGNLELNLGNVVVGRFEVNVFDGDRSRSRYMNASFRDNAERKGVSAEGAGPWALR